MSLTKQFIIAAVIGTALGAALAALTGL